jgi:diguanylate cyclase (GGDEF)-like protein
MQDHDSIPLRTRAAEDKLAPGRRRYRDRAARVDSDTADGRRESLSAEQIETQLRQGHRWLRFSAPLEARYESDSAPTRRPHLSAVGVIGTLIYTFLSLNDSQLMPDIAALCRQQMLVMVPLLLSWSLLVRRAQNPVRGELLMSLAVLGVAYSVMWNISLSHSPFALPHAATLALVPMFAGIAARLRFWYTLAVSLLTLLGFVLMLRPHTPAEALMVDDFTAVVLSSTVFSLFAGYSVEYRDRTAWLLRKLEKRRRQALAEANERLRKLSMCDSLTGIGNRRQFDLDLATRWLRAARTGDLLALLLIDIDHFKLYNDRYGHPAGDSCLQRVATRLGELAAAQGGVAARLGGEEFAVMLPSRNAGEAADCAEQFRLAVRRLEIPHDQAPTDEVVTVSVGVALAKPAVDESHLDIIEAADRALYQAKAAGRNRICVVTAGTRARLSVA